MADRARGSLYRDYARTHNRGTTWQNGFNYLMTCPRFQMGRGSKKSAMLTNWIYTKRSMKLSWCGPRLFRTKLRICRRSFEVVWCIIFVHFTAQAFGPKSGLGLFINILKERSRVPQPLHVTMHSPLRRKILLPWRSRILFRNSLRLFFLLSNFKFDCTAGLAPDSEHFFTMQRVLKRWLFPWRPRANAIFYRLAPIL